MLLYKQLIKYGECLNEKYKTYKHKIIKYKELVLYKYVKFKT